MQAWRDGYQVPDAEQLLASEPEQPLPEELRDWLGQWDARGFGVWERKARRMMEQGYSPTAILRQFEAEVA